MPPPRSRQGSDARPTPVDSGQPAQVLRVVVHSVAEEAEDVPLTESLVRPGPRPADRVEAFDRAQRPCAKVGEPAR